MSPKLSLATIRRLLGFDYQKQGLVAGSGREGRKDRKDISESLGKSWGVLRRQERPAASLLRRIDTCDANTENSCAGFKGSAGCNGSFSEYHTGLRTQQGFIRDSSDDTPPKRSSKCRAR